MSTNRGEVQAICESASIETTTGTVVFDAEGRTERPRKNLWSAFLTDDKKPRFIFVNEETPGPTEYLTVGFGDHTDIPVADFEAAQRHGWKVASPDAYPCFFYKKGHVLSRPLPWHLDLVEACLRAVPRFVAGSRRYWRGRVAVASGRLSLWLGRGF